MRTVLLERGTALPRLATITLPALNRPPRRHRKQQDQSWLATSSTEQSPVACAPLHLLQQASRSGMQHSLGLPHVAAHAMMSTVASAAVLEAVSGPATTTLSFTPYHAALGGLILGIATVGKLFTTGRVLGISGAIKGLVTADYASWRFAFLGGLLLGGVAAVHLMPTAFTTLPDTFTVSRAALSGLLVGLGTAMGNGCTSGHGICGNARLSPRSFVYTLAFMASGAVTATWTDAPAALNITPVQPALQAISSGELQLGVNIAVLTVATYLLLVALSRQLKSQEASKVLDFCSELTTGASFALGLGLSGMVQAAKVVGFLSVASPLWDPTLMLVMASALAVATIGYQSIMRYKIISKPLFFPTFTFPAATNIDHKLLLGGVLFGAGWGLSGLCPGPALVNLANFSPQVAAYILSLVLGMYMEKSVSKLMFPASKTQLPPTTPPGPSPQVH